MGRRKIEIRPIKDDRNRSVTFLKRKGGLFKKAHELGVLCSVDVAVIIFGHNKKLYEFSSGDINDTIGRFQYYAGAHEHKGPEDFAGRGGGDDDEDEDIEIGTPPPESQTHSPPDRPPMNNNMPNVPTFHHVRHGTPSASPPLPNAAPPHHRGSTPHAFSRPASRTSMPRRPSNLGVPNQTHYTPPQAQMTQPNYAYGPNAPFYNPQQANMRAPSPQPPSQQQQHHHQNSYPQPAQPHSHMTQQYMQDQRRQSMPPAFSARVHPHRQPSPQPPRSQHRQSNEPMSLRHSPQADQSAFTSPPLPQPKALAPHAQSHSIFTPIDDSRSLLAQHWGGPPSYESTDQAVKQEAPRAHSIDVGAVDRESVKSGSPRASHYHGFSHPPPPPPLHRNPSTSSIASIPAPSRTSTMQSDSAKRPRLKVQIPSEQSDGGEVTAESADRETAATSAHTILPPHKGVVLPPPSPSANTPSAANPVLSAGASGPPNPFARPPPPHSNPPMPRDRIETPLSALPSRVMDGGNTLPSPSDMWGGIFSRTSNNDNMMPSPLNWQPTPVVGNGPSFRDEYEADRKRRAEGEAGNADGKRIRT